MDDVVDSVRKEKAILSENPLEDTLLKGQVAQEAALDELGAFHKATEIDLDQPLKGVHDLFDANELGLRSVDLDGVPGVTADAARIAKNIDSQHGALGSIFSEAALREGLQPHNLTKRTLVKSIVNHIKNSGEYKAILASGKEIKWSEIDAAGTKLAALMVDPLMEPGMLKATLKEFKDLVRGVEAINDVGYDAAFKSINHYLDEYLSMDVLKAQGYINSSLAGLGLFGVAVALGAQDLFKNLISGILVLVEKRFKVNDWIIVEVREYIQQMLFPSEVIFAYK